MKEIIAEPILNYWYRALASPYGIQVVCSDPESVRPRLYVARKEARDPDLDSLAIIISPFDPARLWIFKKGGAKPQET